MAAQRSLEDFFSGPIARKRPQSGSVAENPTKHPHRSPKSLADTVQELLSRRPTSFPDRAVVDGVSVWYLDVGSTLVYIPKAIDSARCASLFDELAPGPDCTIRWEQHHIRTPRGVRVPLPRKTALLSNGEETRSTYEYSGITNLVQPMPPSVLSLGQFFRDIRGTAYNVAFANWYADGRTSHIGWHSDAESMIDKESGIGSFSAGGEGLFQILHKDEKKRIGSTKAAKMAKIEAGKLIELRLRAGDVVLMLGKDFQANWLHRVPKNTQRLIPRLNITFRFLRYF